ncbi:MAG: PKD domain-containing protein [Thermoanaerobaculales bacterium]|nr:PKD domain-containing protein [Thermoanaerobaculales bacterium]
MAAQRLFSVVLVGLMASSFATCIVGDAAAACPEVVGRWSEGPTISVAVSSTVVAYARGAQIVLADVSNPASPQVLGRLALGGMPNEIVVVGNLVYVAADEAGLVIVDLSDPANPSELGSFVTPLFVEGVAVVGNLAYLIDPYNGLWVLDVSNPADPTEIGLCDSVVFPYGIAVDGDFAFLATAYDGLVVVDVSDPSDPQQVAELELTGQANGIQVKDDTAYVFTQWGGLYVVDVSQPDQPVELGAWTPGIRVLDVEVVGAVAYVAGGYGGLYVVDVSDPSNPTESAKLNVEGCVWAVAVSGGHAYLASDDAGLCVVDLVSLAEVGRLSAAGESWGVDAAGGYLFVADADGSLRVVDISTVAAPVEVSALATQEGLNTVVVVGDVLYAAGGDGGLFTFDISDPTAPSQLATFDTSDTALEVEVSGTTAYIADRGAGMVIVDVSDPANPSELGTLSTPSAANDLAVAGGYAYVATPSDGLRVVDVSNPAQPVEVGSVTEASINFGVAVAGDYAFVGANYSGLRVIDISDPNNPVDIAGVHTSGGGSDVAVFGELVAVEHGLAGVLLVDVSDPAYPAVVGSWNTPGESIRLSFADGRLLSADREAGVTIFDVSDCMTAAPVADFTWSPTQPRSGEVVQFTDVSSGLPTSWSWDFDDGATSIAQHPTHVWAEAGTFSVALTVSNPQGSDDVSHSVTVKPAAVVPPISNPGAHVYVVPATAKAPGAAGTSWVSDLVVHNPGATTATVNLYFMEAELDNSGAGGEQIEVPAGRSTKLADAVQGIFGHSQASGAILIGSDQQLVISSRTYNNAAKGTFGQYIAGYPIADAVSGTETVALIQLTNTERYRTNLGFANPSAAELHITVSLRDHNGAGFGERSYTIEPFGYFQEHDIIGDVSAVDVADAVAAVSSSDAAAVYFCYASVVDNKSGDPIYVAPLRGSAGPVYVAGAAHVPGANETNWRTDLELARGGIGQVAITIELLRSATDNSSPAAHVETLGGGSSRRMLDALDSMFDFEGAAALRITPASGTVMATSRTFNDLGTETYGQFISGLPVAAATGAGEEVRLIQLAHSPDRKQGFRTNIGCVSAADVATTVTVDLHRGDGSHLRTFDLVLAPYDSQQENDVFRPATGSVVDDGYAVVHSDSAGAGFFCYASVVDNRSSDPVYIPGR